MNDQQQEPRPPLPTSSARYGSLDAPEQPLDPPELFPGEKALSRTKAGSRAEMQVLRKHYNWVNMIVALLACFALVLGALALAPRPSGEIKREIDYQGAAQSSQPVAEFDLAVPELPEGWHANATSFELDGTPAVDTWYVSWVDGEDAWVSMRQVGAETPDAWSELFLEDFAETGESDLGGVSFSRFEGVGSSDKALLGEAQGTLLLLIGSGEWAHVEVFAESAVNTIGAVQDESGE